VVHWYKPVIPAHKRFRQDDLEFEASLSYIVRPCLKNNNKTTKTPTMRILLEIYP
jgi:hypothetical protein